MLGINNVQKHLGRFPFTVIVVFLWSHQLPSHNHKNPSAGCQYKKRILKINFGLTDIIYVFRLWTEPLLWDFIDVCCGRSLKLTSLRLKVISRLFQKWSANSGYMSSTSRTSSLKILWRSQYVRALTSALDLPGRWYRLMGSPKMSFFPGKAEKNRKARIWLLILYKQSTILWCIRWSCKNRNLLLNLNVSCVNHILNLSEYSK